MTVAELIAELQKMPQSATVWVDDGNDSVDIEEVVEGEQGVYIEIPGL